MTTPEQLNDLRRRILAGENPSREELIAAIQALRGARLAAHATTTAPSSKGRKGKKANLDDLL